MLVIADYLKQINKQKKKQLIERLHALTLKCGNDVVSRRSRAIRKWLSDTCGFSFRPAENLFQNSVCVKSKFTHVKQIHKSTDPQIFFRFTNKNEFTNACWKVVNVKIFTNTFHLFANWMYSQIFFLFVEFVYLQIRFIFAKF